MKLRWCEFAIVGVDGFDKLDGLPISRWLIWIGRMLLLVWMRMIESDQRFDAVFWNTEFTFPFLVIPFEVDAVESGSFVVGDGVLLPGMGEEAVEVMLIVIFNAEIINH